MFPNILCETVIYSLWECEQNGRQTKAASCRFIAILPCAWSDTGKGLSISNTSINSNIFASIQSKDTSVGSKIYQKFIDRNAIDRKLIREEWDFCLDRFLTKRLIHFKLQEFSLQSNEAIDRILRTITYIRKDMTTNRQQLIMLIQDEKEGVSEAAIFVALLILLEQFDEAFLSMQNRSGETVFIDIFKTVNELR